MRFCLWCVWTSWILTLLAAAQHPPDRAEGGAQPGGPSPGQPAAGRGAGGKLGGRRAPLPGPHVCGGRCCVGWTLSPKTRRCTKPRCLPRCHNNAVCRQSNRCMCRQGFHGYRCEVSTVTLSLAGRLLTPIRPTGALHLNPGPSSSPPGPEPGPEPGTRKEPAGSTTLSPSVTPDSAPDESAGAQMEDGGGVTEENRVSSKSPQVGRRAARTEDEFNTQTGDSGDTEADSAGLSPKLKPHPAPKDVPESREQEGLTSPASPSRSWSWSEGTGATDLTENQMNKIQNLDSNLRPDLEDGLSLELNAGPSQEFRLNLESQPGPRGGKSVDPVLTGEKRKKEEEEVKKQSLSLREAQAVLLRKTLSRGGRGDKMAALLMKHIEKERKKLVTVTSSSSSSSSSVSSSSSTSSSSVKSFHTQKGRYTVHFTAPAGRVCQPYVVGRS